MPVPVLLIAAAAAAAAKGISGAIQAKKAKNEAEKLANSRPLLPNNQYAQDSLALTENELARGDNSPGMRAYDEGVSNDLSTSIGAILKGGGDVNNIGQLFDSTNQGRQRARLMSENVRMNNVQNFLRASQVADNANQQQFQFNQWAPWADQSQANAQSRLAANQKIWGAVDEFGSAAMQYGYGQGNGYNNAAGDGWKQINSTPVQGVSNYNTPSVAGQFNTIDPNRLTNWNINQTQENSQIPNLFYRR